MSDLGVEGSHKTTYDGDIPRSAIPHAGHVVCYMSNGMREFKDNNQRDDDEVVEE